MKFGDTGAICTTNKRLHDACFPKSLSVRSESLSSIK